MAADRDELARRERLALAAIQRSLGTEAGEYAATLFASHHLDELDSSYWRQHLGIDQPEPAQVLGLLGLVSHSAEGDAEGLETLDFALPGEVSDSLLSVRFDEAGELDEIAMES